MYSNITDITKKSMDIQEILMDTDILISDYSSTYIDYLLLDRPLIFYNFDYEDYLQNDREMYYDYDEVTPGYKAATFDEVSRRMKIILLKRDRESEICSIVKMDSRWLGRNFLNS